jgi:predicted AAA+ superfamily ATPase
MNFSRKQSISAELYPKRVLIIYGPRRVGKTTLLREYLATQPDKKILSVVGEDVAVREIFASERLATLRQFAEPFDIIAIDEAQHTPSIGLGLKMLVDTFPEKTFIATGSSSFELGNQVGEPLTGRHFSLTLLPLAQLEIHTGSFTAHTALDLTLIYGSYPEVLATDNIIEKERILSELISSYLYKDVLALDKIKSPDLLRDITRMLAYQIGQEVSLNEIATTLHMDVKTVGRYIDLLEKMFIIKKARGFSRNLRNEISKKARYYFLDNGIRNAVINQFSPLSVRNDHGALWENFCYMELVKKDNLATINSTFYFWRTHQGQEVDIVREHNGTIIAYECKWGIKKIPKAPKLFTETYPKATYTVINPENFTEILLPNK